MTADFIQIELFAIFIAVGIGICIWGIWKIVETLAEEYDKEQKKMTNELFERELQNTSINDVSLADYIKENYVPVSVLEQIRAEIEDCKQYQFETYGIQRYFKINDIWQIIDKYRS